jgi:hypothetical protein
MFLLMHPGRRLGATLGFATFFAAYFLPFARGANEPWLGLTMANSIFGSTLSALENLSSRGSDSSAIILVVGAVMIVAGGTLGVRPEAGAVLGVAGMVAGTLGEYLSSAGRGISLANYGAGYWVLWATAIGTLAATLWVWRDERPLHEKKSAKGWSG